jgi:hypothetical protein
LIGERVSRRVTELQAIIDHLSLFATPQRFRIKFKSFTDRVTIKPRPWFLLIRLSFTQALGTTVLPHGVTPYGPPSTTAGQALSSNPTASNPAGVCTPGNPFHDTSVVITSLVPSSYASNIEAITEAGEAEVGALVKSIARVKPEAEPRDEREGREVRPVTVKYWAVLKPTPERTCCPPIETV